MPSHSPGVIPLQFLPDHAADIGRSMVCAAERLVKVGFARQSATRAFPFETFFLTQSEFAWRFFVTQKTDKKIFFFFRRRSSEKILLDSRVTMGFKLWDSIPSNLVADPEAMRFYYNLPPFIQHFKTTKAAQNKHFFPPGDGKTAHGPKDNLLVALGNGNEDMLGLAGVDDGNPKLRYTPKAGEIRDFDGKDNWPMIVVIELIQAIRNWVGNKIQKEKAYPFTPFRDESNAGANSKDRIVHSVIENISRAYCSGFSAVLYGNGTIFDRSASMGIGYGINDYQAKVSMRLDEEGQLSGDEDDNTFQLALNLSIVPENSGPQVHVAVEPPDYLVAGEFRQKFLDTIVENGSALKKICGDIKAFLGSDGDEKILKNKILGFIQKAGSESVIFRINRKKDKDTDIIVLRAPFDGIEYRMILCSDFKITSNTLEREVFLVKPKDIKILHFLPAHRMEGYLENKRLAQHFLHLLADMQRWLRVLD